MGTKATTSTTNAYNAPSMSAYNTLAPMGANTLGSEISQPYNNTVFNANKAIGSAANVASNLGSRATLSNNLGALGTSGGTGFSGYAGSTVGRFGAATTAQTNNALLMGAASNRNQALGSAMGFRPLQTGGTQTQQLTGTGTWLPSVLGAGVAGASAFMPNQPTQQQQNQAAGYAQLQGATYQPDMAQPDDPVWSSSLSTPPQNYGF